MSESNTETPVLETKEEILSSDDFEIREVTYIEGATPLFLAIEETDWRQALYLAEAFPQQVRTWINSTGTENTTFAWSMWRRLPIHEACRRQAPAWLISALFSTFPESAYLKTQFGELPLHLAVESGGAPEVVNLILVANWEGIVSRDNSGRTPVDILDQCGEAIPPEDHRFIHESLVRCRKTYLQLQQKFQEEQKDLQKKQDGQMSILEQQHQESLKQEHEKRTALVTDLGTREQTIEELIKFDQEKDALLLEANTEIASLRDEVDALTQMISKLRDELLQGLSHIDSLENELQEREKDIVNRDEFIECLAADLRAISAVHEHDVAESLQASETAMRAMVTSQITLQKQLTEQATNIKTLLNFRGIALPPEETMESSSSSEQEEKDEPVEPAVDCSEVALALKAAAFEALKTSPTC